MKVSDGATTVAEYRYDGLGRRIRKYVPDGANWTVTEYYYSVARQVVEVRRDGGKTRSGTPLSEPTLATTLREQYIWSPRYVNAPILRDRDNAAGGDLGKTGSGLDERLYYLTDANMNVTTLADTGGDAVERYTFDPYGKVTIYDGTWTNTRGSSSYDNSYLYCGYWRDNETGLYHVDHRTYHPLFGRWLQRDPLGYADGMNLYQYVSSQPCLYLDPYGLRQITEVEKKMLEGVEKQYTNTQQNNKAEQFGVENAQQVKSALDVVRKAIDEVPEGQSDPAPLKALLYALKQYADDPEQYAFARKCPQRKGSISGYPENTWKCNKLVADCYAAGAGVGLSTKTGEPGYPANKDESGTWGPQANDLARKGGNLRSLTDARDIKSKGSNGQIDPKSVPQSGDIVAYPNPGGYGHSSIYIGDGIVVAAKTGGVRLETVKYEQEAHGGSARVRKYTGTGR